MKPRLFVLVLVEVVALLAYSAPAALGAGPTLEGTYTATGVNVDGSEYRRIVKIVARGESFLIAWILPEKVDDVVRLVPKSAGVGVVSGNVFAASFYGQNVTGVILYQIEDGGARLVGRWVDAEGDGVVRSETLTKVQDSSVPAGTPDTGEQQPAPSNPIRTAMSRHVVANR